MGLTCASCYYPQIQPSASDDKDTVETENKVSVDKINSIQLILQNENFYLSFIDFITLHGKEKLFIAYEELEALKKITPLPTTVSTISGKETRRTGNYNYQALLGTTHSLLSLYRKEQMRMQREEHETIASPPHSFHMFLSRSNSGGSSFALLSHQNSGMSNHSSKSNRSGKSNATSIRSSSHHNHHHHHQQQQQQQQKRKEMQEELIRRSLLPLLHYTQPEIQVEQLHTFIKESQLQLLEQFVPVLDEFVQSIEFQKLLTSITRASISTNQLFQSLSKSYDATVTGSSTSSSSYGNMGPGFIPQLGSSFDELRECENENETINVPATPSVLPSGVFTDFPQHDHTHPHEQDAEEVEGE
jgi:hypothetical protein